jgi:hypothetical protein
VAAVSRLPAGLGALGRPWRPRVPRIPAAHRAGFRRAVAVNFLTWAVTALCLTLVPAYLAAFTGRHDLLLAGLAAGLILLTASLVQLAAPGVPARWAQSGGLAALSAGMLGLLGAGAAHSAALVLVCSAVAGIGQGLAFMGALRESTRTVGEAERGGVIAAFYMITYVGFGVPIIGVGLLATLLGTGPAVQLFVAVFVPLSLVLAFRVVRAG